MSIVEQDGNFYCQDGGDFDEHDNEKEDTSSTDDDPSYELDIEGDASDSDDFCPKGAIVVQGGETFCC